MFARLSEYNGLSATQKDIPQVAGLLANSMYNIDMPKGQRKELARLELQDLQDRYGEKLGRRTLPSALLVLEEESDLIG